MTIMGSISGVSPTATATANRSASTLGETVDKENGGHHDHDEADHQPCESIDAFVEGGQLALSGDLIGELSKVGFRSGMGDHADPVSADDARAHEADIRKVERIGRPPVHRQRRLFRRHRFAGKRPLVDKEVLGADEPQIRRDHVAGREPHEIAGNELIDRNLGKTLRLIIRRRENSAAPFDARRRLDHRAEFGGGVVGAMLLDEGGRDRQDDHDQDDDGGAQVAEKIGRRRKREQQRVQGVLRAPPQLLDDARTVFLGDPIGTARRQSCRRLVGLQPVGRRSEHQPDSARVGVAQSDDLGAQANVGVSYRQTGSRGCVKGLVHNAS